MLSPAQIDARKGRLTASRIACIMNGDAAKILQLYRQMIGEEQEEDLRHVWPVRLGEITEQLNLDWYEEKNRTRVTKRGDVMGRIDLPWAACTLDGWIEDLDCPLECKHVGGREPLEVIIERYQPQMQWIMEVTQSDQCALSVIFGANEPVVEFIERNEKYAAEMVKRGEQFMQFVKERKPPVALEPVPPPIEPERVYEMTGNNVWASAAADWIETKPLAKRCSDAEKILKSLVPADGKKCHGHGVSITRDRAGRLSLREATQ